MRLLTELIDQLPEFDVFNYNLVPNITNWLAFYWAGFEQTTRYTYRIEDLSNIERIWLRLTDNTKRDVRKAQKNLKIRNDLDIEELLKLNELTFKRQGIKYPYDKKLILRLDKACLEHDSRRFLPKTQQVSCTLLTILSGIRTVLMVSFQVRTPILEKAGLRAYWCGKR